MQLSVGSTSFARTYARDGLVTSETATIGSPLVALATNGQSQAFSYDGLGRLVGSDLPGTTSDRSYAYDRNGNRTSATLGATTTTLGATTTTTYTNGRTDALISQSVGGGSPTSFAYDQFGNLLTSAEPASGVTTYTYDLGDRLTGIDPPTQAATTLSTPQVTTNYWNGRPADSIARAVEQLGAVATASTDRDAGAVHRTALADVDTRARSGRDAALTGVRASDSARNGRLPMRQRWSTGAATISRVRSSSAGSG